MICPKCNYKLVLLSNRRKYKCALCSRLYPQKQAEDKAFGELNLRERKLGIEKLELELNKLREERLTRRKLREIKKIEKALRLLFNGQRARGLTAEQKRKKKQENNRVWNDNNPEKYRIMKNKYAKNNKEKLNNYQKQWRKDNLSVSRLRQRLVHYRKKQRMLADQYLKFSEERASTITFYTFPPTFALCELLFETVIFKNTQNNISLNSA